MEGKQKNRECDEKSFTATLADGGKILKLGSEQGEFMFHAVWLRKYCKCSKCFFSSNGHTGNLIFPHQLDPATTIVSVEISGQRLNIEWSCGHQGFVSIDWLMKTTVKPRQKRLIADTLPKMSAEEVLSSDEAFWRWMKTLNEYGFCLLTGLSTEGGDIGKIASRFFGFWRTTEGDYFRVITKDDAEYVGYTPRPLPMHLDYSYYENSPGLMLLHCIRNDVEGGLGVVLDSHIFLEELRTKHPEHFATLTRVKATFFDYHEEGPNPVDKSHKKPHIVLDEDGQVKQFRWNPSQEGVLDIPLEDVLPYYEAYTCLGKMIEDSPHKIYHKYMPGDVITLYNWRAMHGRTTIKLNGGVRILEGGGVLMDEWWSKFRTLSRKLGHEEESLATGLN